MLSSSILSLLGVGGISWPLKLLSPKPLQHSLKIKAINAGLIISHIVQKTLTLQVSALHYESISLLFTVTTKHPIILRFPWMQQHDPQISWQNRDYKIAQAMFTALSAIPPINVASTMVERTPNLSGTTIRGLPWLCWGLK